MNSNLLRIGVFVNQRLIASDALETFQDERESGTLGERLVPALVHERVERLRRPFRYGRSRTTQHDCRRHRQRIDVQIDVRLLPRHNFVQHNAVEPVRSLLATTARTRALSYPKL